MSTEMVKHDRRFDDDGGIHIPRWAIAILLGLVANLLVGAFSAGITFNKIDALQKELTEAKVRLYNLEQYVYQRIGGNK